MAQDAVGALAFLLGLFLLFSLPLLPKVQSIGERTTDITTAHQMELFLRA